MQNKLNLEAIKHWFYNTKIAHLQDVPAHYFEPLYSLGLIDSKLCETSLKHEAIDANLNYFAMRADSLDAQIKPYLQKDTLKKFEQLTYDNLLRRLEQMKSYRNAFAFFKIKDEMHDSIKDMHKDMYQRAQVFYSKPLITTSNLDTIAGVDGAPYYQ